MGIKIVFLVHAHVFFICAVVIFGYIKKTVYAFIREKLIVNYTNLDSSGCLPLPNCMLTISGRGHLSLVT